jgi:hypothetical protein
MPIGPAHTSLLHAQYAIVQYRAMLTQCTHCTDMLQQERAPVQQQYLRAYLSNAQGLHSNATDSSSKHSDYLKDVQRFLHTNDQVGNSFIVDDT